MIHYETAAFKEAGVRKTQLDLLVELSDLYPSTNFRISDITFIAPDMVIATITLMEKYHGRTTRHRDGKSGTG